VVVVSAAVNVVHTASHAGQHIMFLPLWQLAFIALVIFAAPVMAAVLLWTRYRVTGAWLLVASTAGSLVGESEAACHRVVRRAKWFVAARRPRFESSSEWKDQPE
jgi:hypothetical protein